MWSGDLNYKFLASQYLTMGNVNYQRLIEDIKRHVGSNPADPNYLAGAIIKHFHYRRQDYVQFL